MDKSIPFLSKSVVLREKFIEDLAMREKYPINDTAFLFFSLVDGKKDVRSISNEIAHMYQKHQIDVLDDVKNMIWKLQIHHLINIKESFLDRFWRFMIIFLHFMPPKFIKRRFDVPKTKRYSIILFYSFGVVLRALFAPLFIALFPVVILGFVINQVSVFFCYMYFSVFALFLVWRYMKRVTWQL